MRVIRDLEHVSDDAHNAVMGLGNFDGVHRGHQVILRECAALAKAENTAAAVMTFAPHPREFFKPDSPPFHLYSLRRKLELFADAGIDIVFLARFNRQLAATGAESFIEDLLYAKLGVRHVVTGYNFAFGKGRAGDTEFLASEARKLGFGFTAVPPVKDPGGAVISSTAIRAALAEGDLEKASHMLGRPYQIAGHVRHGDKRGRQLGFPTANLGLGKLFKPRLGVYAARLHDGNTWHEAVVNIGIRPTFSPSEPLLEAHVLSSGKALENPDLYGRFVRVELMDFIRDEKKFEGLEALKTQIGRDCDEARARLSRRSA